MYLKKVRQFVPIGFILGIMEKEMEFTIQYNAVTRIMDKEIETTV